MNQRELHARMPRPAATRITRFIAVTALVVAHLAGGTEARADGGADGVAATAAAPGANPESRLDAETVERIGLELETVTPSRRDPEVLGYGRVLDPVPLVAAVTRLSTARARADRADKDRRRVEELARNDQNASARELEAARADASAADSDRELAEAELLGLLGPTLAATDELPTLARDLARRSSALARVDVPAGSPAPDPRRGARLWIHPGLPHPLQAEFVGPAPTADPRLPGWGLLFLLSADAPPPGTPIRARIRAAEDATSGVELPAEALVRSDGALFVFVEREAGVFERVAVQASSSGEGRWLVTSGVEAGDRVVVSGAEQLLSAQLLGADSGVED